MAGFRDHLTAAAVIGAICVTVLPYSITSITMIEQLLLFFILVISTEIPDLDSDNSKPVRIVYSILVIILPILTTYFIEVFGFLPYFEIINYEKYAIILAFIFSLILFAILFWTTLILTKHRGVIHTIPMALFSASLIATIFNDIGSNLANLVFLFSFIGVITHLVLDEIYSIFKMSKSFGSALKLYDKNNITGTFILYCGFYYLAIYKNDFFFESIEIIRNII